MLGGLDPVIIFQFSKNTDPKFVGPPAPGILERIPLLSQIPTLVDQPPIPVYLSESAIGLFIDTEDKNIDIQTDVETLTDGSPADVNQKGIASTVSVTITAKKNMIGITLLSSLLDLIFDKVSAKEYAISYLHGATTIFRGVLHNYSISQSADNDLVSIKVELSKGSKTPVKAEPIVVVPGFVGPQPSLGAG